MRLSSLACVAGVVLLTALATARPIDTAKDCGVLNPPEYYQRYRRSEYPLDKPFFQWWYFWVHNEITHEHFFFRCNLQHVPSCHPPTFSFYHSASFLYASRRSQWFLLLLLQTMTFFFMHDLLLDLSEAMASLTARPNRIPTRLGCGYPSD